MRRRAFITVIAGGPSDTTAPTVTITSTETSPTFAATIPLTITFSEAVTGFVVGDITVVGCTLGALTTSDNITFSVTATPTANTITVDIAAGVCVDAAGNANTAATQFAIVSAAYNLAARWDFSTATGLYQTNNTTTPVTADGQTIGYATDKSGAGKHATQATAGARPLYKTNIQNSLSAALFDASNDLFNIPADIVSAASGATYFVAGRKAVDPPVDTAKTGPPLAGIGGAADEVFPYTDGVIYDRFAATVRKTVGNPTPSLALAFIYDAMSKASEWTARLNGAALFTTATNTVGYQTGIAGLIGKSQTSASYYDGYIFEILMYNAPLTLAERQAIENFLNTKWVVF